VSSELATERIAPGLRARVFASADAPADASALEILETGVRDADLAVPPVVLPDFLHKSRMEMPSSIAIATRSTIRPTFTSSSVNCGMALLALDADRPSQEAVADFFVRVRDRLPWPPRRRVELTASEVLDAAERGGGFAAERFDLDGSALERIEEAGRIDIARYGGRDRLRAEIPWLVRQLARLRFGSIGPSNHFIELQHVEEILDPAAERLGLAAGQTTIQYHGGGGVLAGLIGRLYAQRIKVPRAMRPVMAVTKPMHHLARAGSAERRSLRRSLYFTPGAAIERASDEGERFMLANAAAMNYGFAFRLATYATLLALASETFGARGGELVVDSPHNSIYDEEVDGAPAVVHRHNSCRAYPADRMPAGSTFASTGQALLLPGTFRTASYLCVATPEAHRSSYSACHGAGAIISDFAERGISGADVRGRRTLRFGYDGRAPEDVAQLDDRGVDEALRILVDAGICRPVARLRPLGVLR
jgi:RNA-splicing ligase RtcB